MQMNLIDWVIVVAAKVIPQIKTCTKSKIKGPCPAITDFLLALSFTHEALSNSTLEFVDL